MRSRVVRAEVREKERKQQEQQLKQQKQEGHSDPNPPPTSGGSSKEREEKRDREREEKRDRDRDNRLPARGETPLLMLDRWRKLHDELYDSVTGFDITKVGKVVVTPFLRALSTLLSPLF